MISGIIPVDKPKGYTSFDVVARMRGILHEKKIGHSGTLDPMATGVLPLFINSATKTLSVLTNEDKTYTAWLKLGMVTDTQDISGNLISSVLSDVSYEEFNSVISGFTGEGEQIPPMYSAAKVNGIPLYDLARKGIEIERTPKKVIIYSIDIDSFDSISQSAVITVKCGRGTFIRTLINDIGVKLGCGAVMTELRRISACGFDISDCRTPDEIETLYKDGNIESVVVSPKILFKDLPSLTLGEYDAHLYRNGVNIELAKRKFDRIKGNIAVYDDSGALMGISYMDEKNNALKLVKMLNLE